MLLSDLIRVCGLVANMEVRLAGAVLSGIARDVATCEMGDCDGLIWGRWDVPRAVSRPEDYSQPGASASASTAYENGLYVH